jgi:copper type II ascorbate-dependent monooxygenase-like protein
MTRRICFPIALFSFVTACDPDPEASSSGDDDDGTVTVRFHEDVAPILANSCNGCHQQGGVAPFALDSYDAAVQWSGSIVAAVQSRTMPPFNVDNSGSCNTYTDARWLADDEIATISDWVDQGMEKGDASLGMPAPPAPRTIEGDDIVMVSTPEKYQPVNEAQPAAPADDYQCFLVDPETDDTSFLVGYDVLPGNSAIVHHVLAFDVDPERFGMGGGTNGEIMAALDAESPDQPGWNCFNAAGDGVWVEGVPVTWAPGAGATKFPAGTGIRVKPGHKLVVQMHYHLAGANIGTDTTEIQLAFADHVEREAHSTLIDGFLLTLLGTPAELPAGVPDASFEWSMALADIPYADLDFEQADLFGVLPHMHQRGRKMTVDVERKDGEVCGARVDHWDYDWQQAFYYEQPIPVDMTDKIKVRCEWDTTADSEPVLPGLGTDAEMCLVGVYVVERTPA